MAAVAAVYTVAPFARSADQDPGGPAPPGGEAGLGEPRTEPGGGHRRGDAGSGAHDQDQERAKRWVVLVDGAERQLDLVEAGADAYGVEVTVVLDIIHVVEYF